MELKTSITSRDVVLSFLWLSTFCVLSRKFIQSPNLSEMKSRQLRKWMEVSTIEQVVASSRPQLSLTIEVNAKFARVTRMNVLGPLAELHYATTKEVWPV